jgi:alkanesulfonate monooxygenase SsuD/methylene tetrahydromethanopterin reductase-like flavin-dependent oxidoreductase (luciferase family)
MKFGIFDHLDRRDDPLRQFYEDRLRMVAAIEKAGFHSYHVAEHHATPLGMAPSPNVFLAAASRETTTLRLGTLVHLLPLYHPVRLIEEICMLDHLSGGRIDFGVGRGISPHEVRCYGVEPDDRQPMFEECLAVVLKGLTSERLSHEGTFYHVPDMPMELRPLQQPHPPLWYGAANEHGTLFSAERGMHMVTMGGNDRIAKLVRGYADMWEESEDARRRAGSPVTEPFAGVSRQMVVAETDEEAERLARPAYAFWYGSLVKLWREHGAAPVTGMILEDYDQARAEGAVVAGSPETVRRELEAQAAQIRFNYFVCQFAWGSLTHEQEMRSLALFADEVMPALAGL